MSTILFDTLKLSRTLLDKGHFSTEQAEALAEALGQATADSLATKTDIAMLETRISEVKSDLLKWIIGAIGFQTVAIPGAVFALAMFLKP